MKVFYKQQNLPESSPGYMNSASSTDCTGLITVPPESEDEYDAYNEIYNFVPHLPVNLSADKSALPNGCSSTDCKRK